MSFKPNQFGLYDLGGNVLEWVSDKFSPSSSAFVLRGGSWDYNDREDALSSSRLNREAADRDNSFGFRCVLVGAAAGEEAR